MKKTLTFENWVSVLFMFIAVIASIYYFIVGVMEDNATMTIYNGAMLVTRAMVLSLVSTKTITD